MEQSTINDKHLATGCLVSLLQAALGCIPQQLPDGFDMKSAYALAQRQEVAAIAMDGLQRMSEICPRRVESGVDKAVKMQWIGCMMAQEKHYANSRVAATNLAALYHGSGICTYVLKGLSISQLYPNPSHRFSCDMDCFLLSQSGALAYKVGNDLAAASGCEVDDGYYKHSSFMFRGLAVENHRYCCSVKRSRRTRALEDYLQELLRNDTPRFIDGTQLALPPRMFQALFLIEHTNGHFLYSKMSIKHICDWAVMRQAFRETLDWTEFDRQCRRFGLNNFVECMNRLADYVLGVCSYNDLLSIDKRVLADTVKDVYLPHGKMRQRMEKALGVLHSSWKFRNFCADSMLKELTHSIWAHLFSAG